MDYEKAHKEALERAKKELTTCDSIDCDTARLIFRLFPQLAESEDERIRKNIRLALLSVDDAFWATHGLTAKEAIAYLEKQKEQKPSINIDQLKSLMLQYLQEAANEKDDLDIEADTDKWARKILEYDFEQKPTECISDSIKFDEGFKTGREVGFREGIENVKPAEWSEEDKKMMNEIITIMDGGKVTSGTYLSEYAAWLRHLPERFNLQPKPKWSEEDIRNFESLCEFFNCWSKEHYCYSRQEAMEKWLFNRFRIFPPRQAEWNEEDKKRLESIKEVLRGCNYYRKREDFDWLYYLPHRVNLKTKQESTENACPHWKPSGEQMSSLTMAISNAELNGNYDYVHNLKTLCNDLYCL